MVADAYYLAEADKLHAAAEQAAVKYGPSSQAVVFLKYEELIRLWHVHMCDGPDPRLRERLTHAAEHIRAAYARQLSVRRDHPTRVVGEDPLVIEFDRAVFQERYAVAAPEAVRQTWQVDSPEIPEGFATGAPHMFVIDDLGNLLIWRRRFSFRELIFGRAKSQIDGVPVAHPMLVPDRLRVRTAGEIVLIGAPRVHAMVVNTKSGHFRPPPSTGTVVREVCAERFAVPTDRIDVFTVGGLSDQDYEGSTHRLARAVS
ncbi:hypothetical protein [Streptomyces profundus]|uniref:hypothetical protein n=1 Tax=Streptomyces profundus TaxID=2867410 RepID=UPI001D15F6EE|nr:hypothetical protein [Streptomyces sp. MA3_2.13]UED83227.1 hypothetical protein K4G22_02615 [Streptomyces sp. MA3_2.13]